MTLALHSASESQLTGSHFVTFGPMNSTVQGSYADKEVVIRAPTRFDDSTVDASDLVRNHSTWMPGCHCPKETSIGAS
jgi:hypothetical protein